MAWKYEPDPPYSAPPPPQPQYYVMPPQPPQQIAPVPQNTVMGGIQANIQQMLEVISAGEQLKKMFKEDKKEEKKEDKKEEKKKWTNFTRSDMFCLSAVLMFTSPWTGYWLTAMLVHQLGSWGTLLGTITK